MTYIGQMDTQSVYYNSFSMEMVRLVVEPGSIQVHAEGNYPGYGRYKIDSKVPKTAEDTYRGPISYRYLDSREDVTGILEMTVRETDGECHVKGEWRDDRQATNESHLFDAVLQRA